MIRTPAKGAPPAKKAKYALAKKKQTKQQYVAKVPYPKFYKCPFPPILGNQMVYVEQTTIALTGGVFNYCFWSCNGLWDPNVTGTGTQPLYFDQLSAIYNHYTVVSSFCEFQLSGATTTHNQLFQVAYIDDDTSGAAGSASCLSRPGAVGGVCDSSVQNMPPLRLGWSAAKTFNNTQPWTDPELQGNAASNPAEQSYFVYNLSDASAQTTTYSLLVKMTFNVVWDELKTISTS